ncbi:MAG: ChbG/HpnK family deacetylase [Cytophaga sp.]|uniref:ChbG/HpnK family deacetylase n=1 Tax=Cytophaga sp. TaxID=29535 RepID=UPI003F7FA503
MQKKLILNADDYGWDKDATAGILNLVTSGKIQNVSILANHCTAAELQNIQPYQSSVSTGLHVCLNAGMPVLKTSSSSIQHESGAFFSSKELFIKALTGKVTYKDVYNEINAQYTLLKDAGIEVSHADSHQHLHQYPFLSSMITQALHEVGIKKIRNCMPYSIYDTRRIIVAGFCAGTKNNLRKFSSPDVLITDFTNKHFNFNTQVPELLKRLNTSSYQTIEWMCHPALADRQGSYLQRKNEYDFLMNCDWDELLKELSIGLSKYSFL